MNSNWITLDRLYEPAALHFITFSHMTVFVSNRRLIRCFFGNIHSCVISWFSSSGGRSAADSSPRLGFVPYFWGTKRNVMQRSGLGAKTRGEKPGRGLSDEAPVVWMSSLCLCVPDANSHHSGVRCPLFSSPSLSCLRLLLLPHCFHYLQFSLHHSAAPFRFFILISSRSQGKPLHSARSSFLPSFLCLMLPPPPPPPPPPSPSIGDN